MALRLLPLFLAFAAWALAQVDPLRPAEEPPLGYRLTLSYAPSVLQGVGADERGPYACLRVGHGLSLSLGLSYRVAPDLFLEGRPSLGVGLAYRFPDLWGRPRVRLGLGYPWALEGEASGSLLRDPVVATWALGVSYPRGGVPLLGLGLGLSLVANEVWSLGLGTSLSLPLGLEPLGGALLLRAGYALDPEGKGEVGVRVRYGDGGFALGLELTGPL
ncbi:hypothetical protein [Thermus scotoductus]|uniref:Outer membrane protein beta-barrel domain-containing protein n=1 Tax=Thermus scotoductus TaxID=37636 RepID=A0A430QZA6_THESC|nr:hypothetical protein [Thermus scotoductus]RTH00387.1 hypothetical protein CSW45_13580 [Thermus scotoductus]